MAGITRRSEKEPLLKTRFLSHGTLEVVNLQASRRFYEEVLGLEVIQHAPIGLLVRLGSDHVYVAVETPKAEQHEMPLLGHNGLDVSSREEVDEAHAKLSAVREEYGIRKLTRPVDQHGTYAFYLQDLDRNWWEIGHLPPGGHTFRFEDPKYDLTAPGTPEDGTETE
jgi:catechol 2,3-dioxygenase-like lactoylglutathione lyase family enzyme